MPPTDGSQFVILRKSEILKMPGESADFELIVAFEAGEMPQGGFRHPDHVRVAWWYLLRYPLPEAIAIFSARLKAFATARGKPEMYHETVTIAYVLLISERLDGAGAASALPWVKFAEEHADLLAWNPSILERYYTPSTLWSERARRTFVMPDRLAPPE
jgi:hypothetical protein